MPEAQHPQFTMQEGEKRGCVPNRPVISVLRDGPRTYIWVGNDVKGDMVCFATMHGPAKLRKLALAILSGLDGGK